MKLQHGNSRVTLIANWRSCELKVGAALLKVMSSYGNTRRLRFGQGVNSLELFSCEGGMGSTVQYEQYGALEVERYNADSTVQYRLYRTVWVVQCIMGSTVPYV